MDKKTKPFLRRIFEMIGRVEEDSLQTNASINFSFYGDTPTVDSSRVNYSLTRAIFYASTVTEGGSTYGEDFLLGSAFGKPIVNAAAAFTIGQMPMILIDKEDRASGADKSELYSNLEDNINRWIDDNSDEIFTLVRNSFRDGDSYIEILDDLSVDLLSPGSVEKITDDVTGKLLGYDVTRVVEKGDNGNKQTVKYVTKYRETSPFKETTMYSGNSNNGEVLDDYTIDESYMIKNFGDTFLDLYNKRDKKWPLPIIAFHNDKEPGAKYGNSEYQSVYNFMANYHAVLEAAIKNNIYNSNAVPVLGGIEDYNAFLSANGEYDEETGEYSLNWDANKVILGGPGFNAKMLEGIKTASEAETILNILFWLICQNSETPEFVMGTAVSSSKASVSEQLPVMLRKAERKRRQLNKPIKSLVDLYILKLRLVDNTVPDHVERWIKWLPVLDKDLKVNTDIVKVLSEEGVITDKTKAIMLGIDDYVTDIDTEIEDAHSELEKKAKRADIYGGRELQAIKEKEFIDKNENIEENDEE